MTDTRKILLDAAELIDKPGAWTQGAYARNADDDMVPPEAPDATCFCAMGAISRAAGCSATQTVDTWDAFTSYLRGVRTDIAWVHEWNDEDGRTQAEVVAALRAAAKGAA